MESIVIYHGSINKITKPVFGEGKEANDYGRGFYCTHDIELAREWASAENNDIGFVNKYDINLSRLKVLDLTNREYSVLNWIAILVKHRTFDIASDISKKAKEFLISKYYIDVSKYDVVIGYRADDSYFKYAKDFLNNTISIQQLSRAMEVGNLGIQIVMISENAFNQLNYIGYEEVDSKTYFIKRKFRDEEARKKYLSLDSNLNKENDYITDIMKKGSSYEY